MYQNKNTTNKVDSITIDKNISVLTNNDIPKELSLNDLKLEDRIIIYTKNSQYYFRVLDPLLRTGIVSGGSFGNKSYKAVLLSAQKDPLEFNSDNVIRLNSKIIFLIQDKNNSITRLFTSPIKTLKLSRKLA
ncbi:MAG: hypothetical protein HY819_24140 [Acidobacteria bacterium]|nr:hypothetical protein [Acidobacteriota bacterium]